MGKKKKEGVKATDSPSSDLPMNFVGSGVLWVGAKKGRKHNNERGNGGGEVIYKRLDFWPALVGVTGLRYMWELGFWVLGS